MIALLYSAAERFASELRSLQLLWRVLFVALRGLYLSRRGLDPAGPARLLRARRAAYRTLWALLEDPYWRLRRHDTDDATVRALLCKVSTFLGENFLAIRGADQTLVSQYLLSLRRLTETIHLRRSDPIKPLWEVTAATASTTSVDFIAVLQETVELRERVLRKMRRELQELRRD